ncbi:MAG: SurA N-terminal domain-containing protein [Anaerolineales bacterium]|nr:SurA N-terminal domain-containing protein [Anaerolineales bacterium]
MNPVRNFNKLFILFFITIIVVSGCGGNFGSPDVSATPILPTRTPFPPSPTPIPTAAIVNGDLITLAEYQEELARYNAAVNRELTPEDQTIVINELINLTLLSQAAGSEGFQLTEGELDSRIAALDTEEQPLTDWLAANGFTEDSFQNYLKRSLEAAWMRDQIVNDVPWEMEHIHAQQMLFYDPASAQITLESINEGKDFSQLASNHDPQTQGDLGWFPRGFLTIPALDPILFALEIGATSDIIETEIGYHIIKVLDKQENRSLDPAIRQILQEQALDNWFERRWKLSTIEITLPS